MNSLITSLCFVAVCAIRLFGGATATADDTKPAWLLPQTRAQAFLKRSETNLFPDFYTAPSLPFVTHPREHIDRFEIGTMSANDAQIILDHHHAQNPAAVFLIRVTGTLRITDAPLSPHGRTCFVFEESSQLVATSNCTATSLLTIQDKGYISITGAIDPRKPRRLPVDALFFGNQAVDVGILIQNSGKIHLDQVSIAGCREDGVRVIGRGVERYDEPVSLTRSVISECQGNGVVVSQSPACIVLDSKITSAGRAAIVLDSPSSVVANTLCETSGAGIVIHSAGALLVRNQVFRNVTGVLLASDSEYSLVYENIIRDNESGIVFDGKEATVGWNTFGNRNEVQVGGSRNILCSNHGVSADAVSGSGVAYFKPPTASNFHDDPVVWRSGSENAKPLIRRQVVIEAGQEEVDTREVNRKLEEERLAHPDAVLVVFMQGAFVNRSQEGLSLPDNTCVILDGKIINRYEAKDADLFELVSMKGKGCNSFSGGQIISEKKVFSAVSGADAKNALLLEGVSIDLHSEHGGVGSNSVNAVSSKKHYGPFVVRGCDIRDPGHRGIWAHVSKRVYALGNVCSAGGFSIDFDAYCFHSAAIFNTVTRNTYHSGIFFEECVKSNTAFANFCEKNPANGICMWTENVQGKTEKNVVACNVIRGDVQMEANRSGLSLGGRAADRTTENNYFFNNRLENLNGRSAILMKKYARDNYVSQSNIGGNDVDIRNWTIKPETNGFHDNSGFHSPDVQ